MSKDLNIFIYEVAIESRRRAAVGVLQLLVEYTSIIWKKEINVLYENKPFHAIAFSNLRGLCMHLAEYYSQLGTEPVTLLAFYFHHCISFLTV